MSLHVCLNAQAVLEKPAVGTEAATKASKVDKKAVSVVRVYTLCFQNQPGAATNIFMLKIIKFNLLPCLGIKILCREHV